MTEPRVTPSLEIRPAAEEDLAACAEIWRVSINDYTHQLAQPPIPEEHGPIRRLHRHLWSTDPARFVVALEPDGERRVVAFASALEREHVWFLSMLFVLPGWQGAGLGRRLLERVLPAPGTSTARGTATDSAQPISNGLYATYGLVPRLPLLNVTGLPRAADAFELLPDGITAVPFDTIAAGGRHAALVDIVDRLDREIAGFAHAADHRFLRQEDRHGFLFAGPGGDWLGYGYAGPAGRLGPIVMRDPTLLPAAIGRLMGLVEPRGAWSLWLPGSADRAIVACLRAGLRLEQFPVLLCLDAPPADFERYLPISPGLL